jgi:hypothetical protein
MELKMNLSLSSEDLAFQADVRSWLEEILPEGSPYRGLNLFTQNREAQRMVAEKAQRARLGLCWLAC